MTTTQPIQARIDITDPKANSRTRETQLPQILEALGNLLIQSRNREGYSSWIGMCEYLGVQDARQAAHHVLLAAHKPK